MADERKPRSRFLSEQLNIKPSGKLSRFGERRLEIIKYRDELLNKDTAERNQYSLSRRGEEEDKAEIKKQLVETLRERGKKGDMTTIYELETHGWLHDGSLRGIDLKGIDLSEIVLLGADLTGADLSQANLRGAYLAGAKMKGANLTEANLAGAIIEGTDMEDCIVQYADLSRCWIENKRDGAGSLNHAALDGSNLSDAVIQGNLRKASFVGADLQDVWFRDVDLSGANFMKANLTGMKFDFVKTDMEIVLPDGTKHNLFAPISRFTDPNDPDETSNWKGRN